MTGFHSFGAVWVPKRPDSNQGSFVNLSRWKSVITSVESTNDKTICGAQLPKVNSDCASGDTPEKVDSMDAAFGVSEDPR